MPLGAEARPWLPGVARLTLANLDRSARRRTRLGAWLVESLRTELSTYEAPRGEAAEIL